MNALWVRMLLPLVIAGCAADPIERLRLADRSYQLELTPLTWLNQAGYSCYPFAGTIALSNEVLDGELRHQSGPLYLLEGRALLAGALYQARLVNYMETVELTGQLTAAAGSGSWYTAAGCRGVWQATAIE